MAQGRILKRNISQSNKIAQLKNDSPRMLYCFLLPHLDIEGRYSADPEIIRGHIIPKLKGWSIKKIEYCLGELHEVGLIVLYKINEEPYLQYYNFKKYQVLNPDREAKSDIPAPLIDNSMSSQGELTDNSTFKVKVKDKVNVNVNSEIDTPQQKTQIFFESIKNNTQEFKDFVNSLAEKNKTDVNLVERELVKFASYWTELSQSGRKERWQLQPTFEIMRRLATWFGNINKFNGFSTQINKGREILK